MQPSVKFLHWSRYMTPLEHSSNSAAVVLGLSESMAPVAQR